MDSLFHSILFIYVCVFEMPTEIMCGYVLARTTWFAPLCLVDIGKALRLCRALQWVADLSMDNVDFSLDSKLVVDVVNNNNSSNTDFGSIIKYCHRLLSTHFTNSKVKFNRR